MAVFQNLLSGLSIRILEFEKRQYGEFPLGPGANFFGLLIQGTGRFRSNYCDFTIQEGEIVYIPKGCSYTSLWTHENQVRFYSLGFHFTVPELSETYLLQKVEGGARLKELIEQMYEASDRPYLAVSLFYQLYEEARQVLHKDKRPKQYLTVYPAVRYIRAHCCEEIPVAKLAKLCKLSESYFYPTFKAEMGCSPIRYKNMLKCRLAIELLLFSDDTLETICDKLNVSSPSFLRKLLKQETGKTPKQIRSEKYSL